MNHNANSDDIISSDELENTLIYAEEKYIVNQDVYIYPTFLFYHEDELARKLSEMKGSRDGEALPFFKKRIKKYQKEHQIVLADKQREAIRKLFENQLLVLTGGPGTGKTTVIKAMIDVYKSMYPKHTIELVAPMGRASRKLADTAGSKATTIHRLLGYRKGNIPLYNWKNQLICDLLVVDEYNV